MVVVGLDWVHLEAKPAPGRCAARRAGRAKNPKRQGRCPSSQSSSHLASVFAFALIVALILTVCAYDYMTNQAGDRTASAIIGRSLTALVRGPNQFETSYGILGLFILTWMVGGLLTVAGSVPPTRWPASTNLRRRLQWRFYAWAISLAPDDRYPVHHSWHASRLVPYVGDPTNHIIVPYIAIFVVLFLACRRALLGTPSAAGARLGQIRAGSSPPSASGLLAGVLTLSVATNLSIIRADTYYKQGKTADSYQRYDASITLLSAGDRALAGSGLLLPLPGTRANWRRRKRLPMRRNAKPDPAQPRHAQRSAASESAQYRPYSQSRPAASHLGRKPPKTPTRRGELFNISLDYYAQATQLSPHNAGLFNEWGLVYYLMSRYDDAMLKYDESLVLDQKFDQTYLLLGDVYLAQSDPEQAAEVYKKAIELTPDGGASPQRPGLRLRADGPTRRSHQREPTVLRNSPDDYVTLRNLSLLYQQAGALHRRAAHRRIGPAQRARPGTCPPATDDRTITRSERSADAGAHSDEVGRHIRGRRNDLRPDLCQRPGHRHRRDPAAAPAGASLGFMDQPAARKIHQTPIPRMGGVAIYVAFIVALILFENRFNLARSSASSPGPRSVLHGPVG